VSERRRHLRGLQEELRREVDARTLFGEPRVSREDERRMTAEIRDREAAGARSEQAELDAEIRRAATQALEAIDRLRGLLRGDRAVKGIAHHARRLRGLIDKLRLG
jgi:transcription elongation GreA/GreB family factor